MSDTTIIYRELHLKNIKNITLLIIYAIFIFYFLINGEALFEEWDSNWTWTTVIYLVGVSLFLSAQDKLPKELSCPLSKSIIGFLASFLLVTTLFIILRDTGYYFTGVVSLPIKEIVPTFFFQLVVVVCSEEIIFRGVIFRFLYQFHWLFAIVLSAVLFSLFHLAKYQGNAGAFTTAFLMGMILAWCTKRWNIGVAIGIHFAWNAFVYGVTTLI